MPIPADNNFFQKGKFTGFKTAGFCKIAQNFQSKNPADPIIGPVQGNHFAVIDDPWSIDQTDGDRMDPNGGGPVVPPSDPAFDPVQSAIDAAAGLSPASTERIDYEYQDANNRSTVGADGAWLECDKVTIKKGQRLWFHWRFCRFDSAPFNDFAGFFAYPDDKTDAPAAHRQILCDVITLERFRDPSGPSPWCSPWTVGVFEPPNGFKGTLRWVASNGYSLTGLRSRRPPQRFQRPSALLLDNFSIS